MVIFHESAMVHVPAPWGMVHVVLEKLTDPVGVGTVFTAEQEAFVPPPLP